jgi:hypothetical protein
MARLNQKAFKILEKEIEKSAQNDPVLGETQKQIVLDRLNKLTQETGKPVTDDEIRYLVVDLFPKFPEKTIVKAKKVNQDRKFLKWVIIGGGGILTFSALIWLVNLPFPMIRRPVAKTAPILLLPSFLEMDRNYREAMSNVNQADQLVNKATSLDDIELGKQKVTLAQGNLDKLPVWFLGYEPQRFCVSNMFAMQCSWEFTIDEYRAAREKVGRMEAVVFQEKNALTQLNESDAKIQQAKETYQTTTEGAQKQEALQQWQTGMDQLTQLYPQTLAYRLAQPKLQAYQRDYQQIVGTVRGGDRSNMLIEAAKAFALQASTLTQNPPHSEATWAESEKLWNEAIARLQSVPLEDSGYLEAQTLMATYRSNLAQVQLRKTAEIQSVNAYESAQRKTEQLLASTPSNPTQVNRNQTISQLQSIINELDKVESGTTVYNKAQDLKKSAQDKLTEYNNVAN